MSMLLACLAGGAQVCFNQPSELAGNADISVLTHLMTWCMNCGMWNADYCLTCTRYFQMKSALIQLMNTYTNANVFDQNNDVIKYVIDDRISER